MNNNLIELINEIYRKGSVCLSYLHEHYPELIFQADKTFGSLENALKTAGIAYGKFLSGFDMESARYLNNQFMRTVIPILRHTGVLLESQTHIFFVKNQFDPLKVDQNENWYIIKILPWSELTQYLLREIRKFTASLITIIYLKREEYLPKIDSIVFKNFEVYVENLPLEDPAKKTLRIIKGTLNAIKINIG